MDVPLTGPTRVTGTIVAPDCTFTTKSASNAPSYGTPGDEGWMVVWIEKTDTTPGSCTQPKGVKIVVHGERWGMASLLKHPTLDFFVVSWGWTGLSTTNFSGIDQIDRVTGHNLHAGELADSFGATGGTTTFDGCDMTVHSESPKEGAVFHHFLAPQEQASSKPDEVVPE